MWLTKYVVGANANPPKNPRRPPKKGKVMAMNIVNAATEKCFINLSSKELVVWDPTILFVISICRWKERVMGGRSLLTHIYSA